MRELGAVTDVRLRDKRDSWKHDATNYLVNGAEIFRPVMQDPYMRGFLRGLYNRPSCTDCPAKTSGYADLTLGDFWGSEKIVPELDDDKGTSVVLIQTDKGRKALQKLAGRVESKAVSFADAGTIQSGDYDLCTGSCTAQRGVEAAGAGTACCRCCRLYQGKHSRKAQGNRKTGSWKKIMEKGMKKPFRVCERVFHFANCNQNKLALRNSTYWASTSTSTTVNTSVSVDYVLAVTLRNSANRTFTSAGTAADASVRNYVCH